jgi:hypothetical protein
MRTVVLTHSNPANRMLNDLQKMFNPLIVEWHEIEARYVMRFGFTAMHREARWFGSAEIDMALMVRERNPQAFISDFAEGVGFSFVDRLPEKVFGKYPLIRLYHDGHLSGGSPLFGSPDVNIPGWVFQRYNKSGWPPTGTTKQIQIQTSGDFSEFDDDDYTERLKASVETVQLEKQREDLIEVATKTKRKVTPAPPLDVSKVKKPECKGGGSFGPHSPTEMKFNPVRGKWLCVYDGCKMTAVPKRDEDDRSVTLGKGETSLRVIATDDGKTTVLLISDDNIALDITKFVDINDLVYSADLLSTAQETVKAGRDAFAEAESRDITLTLRVGVLGAENLTDQFRK